MAASEYFIIPYNILLFQSKESYCNNFVYNCKWWTTSTGISLSGCMRLQLDWSERDFLIIRSSLFTVFMLHIYTNWSVALQVTATLMLLLSFNIATVIYSSGVKKSSIIWLWKLTIQSYSWLFKSWNMILSIVNKYDKLMYS